MGAQRDFLAFEREHQGERLAWMHRILAHNLLNAVRHFTTRRCDAVPKCCESSPGGCLHPARRCAAWSSSLSDLLTGLS